MFAVKGIYDGKVVVPSQPVSVTGRQEVIITFLDPHSTQTNNTAKINVDDTAERVEIAKSLLGILPSTITDEEVREARLKRVEEKRKILDSLVGLVPSDIDENAIKAERLARQ